MDKAAIHAYITEWDERNATEWWMLVNNKIRFDQLLSLTLMLCGVVRYNNSRDVKYNKGTVELWFNF